MKQLIQRLCACALLLTVAACAGNRPAPIEYRLPPEAGTRQVPEQAPEVEPGPIVRAGPDRVLKPKKRRPIIENPREVMVRKGETLFDIAEEYRVPVRAIIDINRLTPPYAVKTGQLLVLPQPMIYHVVQGDSLLGIARRFNIDANSLGTMNNLKRPFTIFAGQKLALPSVARDNGPNTYASGKSPLGLSTSTQVAAPETPGNLSVPTETAKAPPPPPAPKPAETAPPKELPKKLTVVRGNGKFIMPVEGKLISHFGPKGPGQRNDGINIAAKVGTPVKAAGSGSVVYAGSEIASFGNLVLIKHKDNWVTAYAHLNKILVKESQNIKQGQTIGYVGQTGNVTAPQLHFETRHNARPVDPAPLLK